MCVCGGRATFHILLLLEADKFILIMEVDQVLHMNGGEAKESYASHSLYQRTVISMVRPTLEEAVDELYCSLNPECLKIADLGCSIGSNTLLVVWEIIHKIHKTCQIWKRTPPPSFQVFLNDLHGNDFNALFRSLPDLYKKLEEEDQIGNKPFGACFIAGVPGSFYGRLFPDKSMHFFHSSYSLMWLSKVPKGLISEDDVRVVLNKGNVCIAKTSPHAVHKAYYEQFQRDFTTFLKCRAKELVPSGSMVLTTMGCINSLDPLNIWELIGLKLHDMVQEGLIEEEKLDTFNLPYYAATEEEVKELIEEEGSFTLRKLESFKSDWDTYIKEANSGLDEKQRAAIIGDDFRAVAEPILATHFGAKVIMDNLFDRVKEDVLHHMVTYNCENINLVISLTKN